MSKYPAINDFNSISKYFEHVVESCRSMLKREKTVESWGDQWSMFVWGTGGVRERRVGAEGLREDSCFTSSLWVTRKGFSQRLPWRDDYIMAVLFWVPPVVEWTSFHFEYSSVDALESVVSLGPMLLGILDTKYPAPLGIIGCLTTTLPFLVSARNKLYQ